MGYKRGGGPWGLLGVHDLGPVWGPIYFGAHLGLFGAHLGLFGAHLGPGLQKSKKLFLLLPIQAWP